MKTRDFEKVARRLARKRRGDDEWPLTGMPFSVLPSRREPRQVLFTTKPSGVLGFHLTELAGEDTTCVWRYGVTSSAEWTRLRTERDLGATVLSFIGDLDPLDLAVFASLDAGTSRHEMKVVHLGVDEEWVRLCVKYLAANCRTVPTIEMSPFEIAAYRALRELPGALPASVGQRCRALLEAGQKLELEGASNPVFYRGGFSAALERMIRRRLKRARGPAG